MRFEPEIARSIDLVIVRELTGDVYFGEKGRKISSDGVRWDHGLRRDRNKRIAEIAFKIARERRSLVTSVDKANVLETSRLWREVVEEVGSSFLM